MRRTTRAAIVGAALFLAGASMLARAGWTRAKGALGEVLLEGALDATLADGREHRPWSWADMHPLARLEVPRLRVRRVIVSNATGSALAFGIGHVDGTAAPGTGGNCALAGHRDSWAEFLKDVGPGDEIVITTPRGRFGYRASAVAVVRFDDDRVLRAATDDRLTLITCWPFSGWLHSPWRYVVTCTRADRVNPPRSGRRRRAHRRRRSAGS